MSSAIQLTGVNLIAGEASTEGESSFRAVNPRTGKAEGPHFHEATLQEVNKAVHEAAAAFREFVGWPPRRLAGLLRAIAAGLEGMQDQLIDVADRETGLGSDRLAGELARTTGQLRIFADTLEDGAHLEAIIETGNRAVGTTPRPDLRRMLVPIGPVAVFGASNFPLAFSVAGGDTASALAAGCTVVVKAHPAHPGTSEFCARAILAAAEKAGAPRGVFSLLHGDSPAVGRALVLAEGIKAVGFTGSLAVGRALFDLGASRPEPIPVYAEMGSLNPVFITEAALESRGPEIVDGFVASMTMGVGQFCTKPGLVFVPDQQAGQAFIRGVAEQLGGARGGHLLNMRIRDALQARLQKTSTIQGVETVVELRAGEGAELWCSPALLRVDLDTFLEHPQLLEEHFGPVSIAVVCPYGRLVEAAARLHGNLTATIHAEAADSETTSALQARLREKSGRLVWNGFPTGVAVTAAMHHGGPYPATTSAGHTSVGTTALRRFLRPVAWQDAPGWALPPALKDENPLAIPRLVNQRWTSESLEGNRS